MDVRCPVCGEPWDNDELHYIDGMSYRGAAAAFRVRGCEVFGTSHAAHDAAAAAAAAAMYDLLGDDMDGAAAMLEDLGY